MIACSPTLKSEIQKLRGRRLSARVRIDYSDANIDNTVVAIASDTNARSHIDQAYNGKEDVSRKWASLDGSWVLGQYALAPVTRSEKEQYEMGWWSERLATPDGKMIHTTGSLYGEKLYGESVYGELQISPTLYVNFTPRTISDIRVSFDNATMEYATDFVIRLRNLAGAVLYSIPVTGNTGTKYVTTIAPRNQVSSLEIEISGWSRPGSCAKIAEEYTSVYELYNGDDIISINVIESKEPVGESKLGATTSGRCVVTLYNRDRKFDYDNAASKLYNLIRENVRIVIEIGNGTEWIPCGTFYAKAWDITKRGITATVTGVDRMSVLNGSEFTNSQIISPPANQFVDVDSDANWLGGSYSGIAVSGGAIGIAYG